MNGPNQHMRTPLGRVMGLGSAHEGTSHFWLQRITGVALVPLTLFFVGLIVALSGRDYEYVRSVLANPFVALVLGLMLVAGLIHMRIGMQEVIEDYVHSEWAKLTSLVLNAFFTIVVGAMALLALIRLSLGG